MKHALSLFHLPFVLTTNTGEVMALCGGDVFEWAGAQREVEQHKYSRLQTGIRGYKQMYTVIGATPYTVGMEQIVMTGLRVFMSWR